MSDQLWGVVLIFGAISFLVAIHAWFLWLFRWLARLTIPVARARSRVHPMKTSVGSVSKQRR